MATKTTSGSSTSITASDLMERVIKPPRFAVSQMIPEGLSILAARPKTGKSWFALGLSLAVSNGSEFMGIPVSKGEVLYCALEDTLQRLRSRLAVLTKHDTPSSDLHLRTQLPRLDEGGLDELSAWLRLHRRARLIVIDTLGKVSPKNSKGTYAAQYELLGSLKTIADQRRCAVLVIHHLRKAVGGDWVDELQGSTAVSGAADALIHLARPRNGGAAVLNITGRDINEAQYDVHFDSNTGRWAIVGDAGQDFLSPERRRLITFIKGSSPATPKKVSDALGLNPHSTRKVLARLCNQRLLVRGLGGYTVPPSLAPDPPMDRGSLGSLGSLDLSLLLPGIDVETPPEEMN